MPGNKIRTFHASLIFLCLLALPAVGLSACSVAGIAESSTGSGNVLFQDDFSNPSSGWMQGEDAVGTAEYDSGGFRIFVSSETAAKVSIPRLKFTNVRVEVDAAKLGGPDDNEFGVVCRYRDEDNFYFFTISSDGYYGIGKYKDNEITLIGMDMMETNDLILQGTAVNHLRADCIGSNLSFYINGQKAAEVQDSDFPSGDVGLLAGSFREPGVDILFDNFSVLKP